MTHTLIWLLTALVVAICVREACAWLPSFQDAIMKCAVARLPAEIRDRYYEEGLAELEQLPKEASLSKTVRALGFLIAAMRIGRDLAGKPPFFVQFRARAFDLAYAAAALVILAPLLVIVATLIQRDGPTLFSRKFVGKHGRSFRLHKFRTISMRFIENRIPVATHLESGGSIDAIFTPGGKFIRSASIDELPQLINVLIGDMSLIGPRPCAEVQFCGMDEQLREEYASYRPGILAPGALVGLSGLESLKFSLSYLRHRTVTKDFVLMTTATAFVLFPRLGPRIEHYVRKMVSGH